MQHKDNGQHLLLELNYNEESNGNLMVLIYNMKASWFEKCFSVMEHQIHDDTKKTGRVSKPNWNKTRDPKYKKLWYETNT